MSWMEKLYLTYEEAMLQEQELLPIAHVSEKVHIKIVLDGTGNFKRASIMDRGERINVPATEKSKMGRTGSKPPSHPLSEKLRYVAKDYSALGGKKASFYNEYSALLKSWCDSKHKHPRTDAIYSYISKGDVVRDLIDKHILPTKDGLLPVLKNTDEKTLEPTFKSLADAKTKLIDFGDALICWSVELNVDDLEPDVWKDKSVQDKWIDFVSDQDGIEGLCYVTGEFTTLANKHPAKVHPNKKNAKLISSNDWQGFTFLGRFTDEENSAKKIGLQSFGIGSATTQKAHAALAWLVQERGFKNDDQVFISWAISGKEIPDSLNDTWTFDDEDDFGEIEENNTSEPINLIDHSSDLGESYALKLRNRMAGYQAKLEPHEQIIIMGLDSTSDGRISIIYYREFSNEKFLEKLEKWHSDFAWYQYSQLKKRDDDLKKSSKPKFGWIPCSPIPKDIALIAYGRLDDNGNLTFGDKKKKLNIKKKVVESLIPCIFEDQQISINLVQACFRNVIKRSFDNNPLSQNSESKQKQIAWHKSLGIACALHRGYCQRQPDINYQRYAMSLEENRNTRDYLFGRLLAVAERIEDAVLRDEDKNRITKAMLYMPRFSERPCETWQIIFKELQPYLQRLKTGSDWRPGFLANRLSELDEIFALFVNDDFTRPGALSCEFLLGYHCQRHFSKNESETTNTQTNSGKKP